MKHSIPSTFLFSLLLCGLMETSAFADSAENEWVICSSSWVTNFGPTDFHVDAGGTNAAVVTVTPKPGWTLIAPNPNPITIPWLGSARWAVTKEEDEAEGMIWYCDHPETRRPDTHRKEPELADMEVYWTEKYHYSPTSVQVNLHARAQEVAEGYHLTPVEYGATSRP